MTKISNLAVAKIEEIGLWIFFILGYALIIER